MRKALLQIHLCVLLWGLTAILGKLITLQAVSLVWWRMLIVVAAVALIPRFWRGIALLPRAMFGVYAAIGCIVALHWVTFYGAIKLANASVAVSCLGLGPVVTSVIEPAVTGRRFDVRELWLGVATLPGVALVVGGTPASMQTGYSRGRDLGGVDVAVRLAEQALRAPRRPAGRDGPRAGRGTRDADDLIALARADWATIGAPDQRDVALLAALALGCTFLPFSLSLVALRELSVFGAARAEPRAGVRDPVRNMLLGEQHELTPGFYAGVAIILGAAVAHPARRASAAPRQAVGSRAQRWARPRAPVASQTRPVP